MVDIHNQKKFSRLQFPTSSKKSDYHEENISLTLEFSSKVHTVRKKKKEIWASKTVNTSSISSQGKNVQSRKDFKSLSNACAFKIKKKILQEC